MGFDYIHRLSVRGHLASRNDLAKRRYEAGNLKGIRRKSHGPDVQATVAGWKPTARSWQLGALSPRGAGPCRADPAFAVSVSRLKLNS